MNDISTDLQSPDSLYITSISDSGVHKVIRRVRPSKFVGHDGIPVLITKDCSDVLMPVLKCTFNLSLSHHICPTLCKQAAFVSISSKGAL